MRETISIQIDQITESEHARARDAEDVQRLMRSMEQLGLLQPIIVRRAGARYQVVAGGHRVAAARGLGWTSIDARLDMDCADPLRAELVEIDENLCRAELSAAQRSHSIGRRQEIWVALHPSEVTVGAQYRGAPIGATLAPANSGTTGSTIPARGRGRPKDFAATTAELTGKSKQHINRQLAVANALGNDLERLVGTSLDKNVELQALAKLPEPERKSLVDRAVSGEQVSARPQGAPDEDEEESFSGDIDPVAELEAAQREIDDLKAIIAADNKNAEAAKWHQLYTVAQTRYAEQGGNLAKANRRLYSADQALKRIAKAVGQPDPKGVSKAVDGVVKAVEKMAKAAEAA